MMASRGVRWRFTWSKANSFGKVTQLRPGRHPGDVCDKCSGELKNQPIMGMVIIRNFKPDGAVWAGGTVVDPENGKEYKGKIWTVGQDKLSHARLHRLLTAGTHPDLDAPAVAQCFGRSAAGSRVASARLALCSAHSSRFRSARGGFQSGFAGCTAQPGYCPPAPRT